MNGSYGHTWLDYDVKGKGDTDIWSAGVDYEITSNYSIILPLMTACILAMLFNKWMSKESIYTMKLTRRGVDLSQGMEVSIMQTTKVQDVMNRDMVVLNAAAGLVVSGVVRELPEGVDAAAHAIDSGGAASTLVAFWVAARRKLPVLATLFSSASGICGLALMLSSVFFDLRVIHGSPELWSNIQRRMLKQTQENGIWTEAVAPDRHPF